MGCPTICILGEDLTFTTTFSVSGVATNATGNVDYSVYEGETTTAILTGTMAQFASITGMYSETISCTAGNGFERFKSYTIRVSATVSGVAIQRAYTTLCIGGEDAVTATTGALTTLANFKTFAGITGTDDDTLITALIQRATSAIEAYCNRTLTSTTYREIYDGLGHHKLVLDEFPVTAVSLLAIGTQDAIKLKNTNSDAYQANVSISSTTMTCAIDGGTNDGTDDFTLSSYTVTTLVAAIDALAKGWDASVNVSGLGVWNADELLPCQGRYCLDAFAYVQVPDEPEHDFEVYGDMGAIYLPTGFPQGHQNVIVRYTAGYATTPADLEQICIDLVNVYYRGRERDSSVKSEKLGDHSITYADVGGGGSLDIPKSMLNRLMPYRKQSLGSKALSRRVG